MMKKTLLGLAISLALANVPAAAGRKPGVDAFFDAMAISVAPGQQSRFVVGDNIDGFYEGYTQANARGEGYVTQDGAVFKGYASFVDGVAKPRASGAESVLPYGHRVSYAGGAREEMALLSKRHAIVMRLTSPTDAALAIQPLIKSGGMVVREADLVSVAPVPGEKLYLALAADQPFSADDQLVIRASAPGRALTVVAAFGANAAEAAQRARALVKGDPIAAERRALYEQLTRSYLATSDRAYNQALNWSKASARSFVVEQFGTGIWAGLPWFRDNWGRDTFIALPGTLLVSGQFEQAKAVLSNFARYQNLREPRDKEYGRIPNRISSGDIIYNTVDGTPWMLREALEYIRYTGDKEFARQMYRLAVPYFEGAIANYMDQDKLLEHDSADTWMDARIANKEPWSARGPRAVEIQALWYTALQSGAYLAAQAGDTAREKQWSALAELVRASFLSKFWDGRVMADRLREDGSRDTKVRPNQLMLVSIPLGDFVPPAVQAAVTRNAVSELLFPYGITSLSQNDPYFHPRHENDAFYHKDAAYHNGTIWGWNAGFTVTALDKFGYQDLAWQLTRNLGDQILHLGTLGSMSELLDALPRDDGTLKPSGTYAQSWSVAEYARNGYQDYVGFKPDLPANTLAFSPAIPAAWTSFYAVLPFGVGEQLEADYARTGAGARWTLKLAGAAPRRVTFTYLNADKSRSQVAFQLAPGRPALLRIVAGGARLDGKALAATRVQASYAQTIGTLGFQTPKAYSPDYFPVLKSKDVLKGIILHNEFR